MALKGFTNVLPNYNVMSQSSSRARTNGAYVIKSAESRPRSLNPKSARNARPSDVTSQDKKLIDAVRQRRTTP